jgi:hypothetical protein
MLEVLVNLVYMKYMIGNLMIEFCQPTYLPEYLELPNNIYIWRFYE